MARGHAATRHRGSRDGPDRPVAGGVLRRVARRGAPDLPLPVLCPAHARRQRVRPSHRGSRRLRRHGPGRSPRGRRHRGRAHTSGVWQLLPRVRSRCARTSSRSRSPSPRGRASPSTATWSTGRSGRCGSVDGPVEGLVLHEVGYDDDGRIRPILYRASVTEMVVPYGDPGPHARLEERLRRRRVGARRHGQLAGARLRLPGRDPLLRRRLQPRAAASPNGPERHLHARGGLRDPLEAHRLRAGRTRCGARVGWWCRSIATVGNYDYGFFWYFYQDGRSSSRSSSPGSCRPWRWRPASSPRFAT